MTESELQAPTLRTKRLRPWTPRNAERLYHMQAWGDGCFFANKAGHVAVRPVWGQDLAIDLYEVTQQLKARGAQFPALVRFQDLLQARVIRLNESFRNAIAEAGYGNVYQGVFPVKVNQLREVVEEIIAAGAPYDFGLECGSKAELVATLPYLESDSMLLICNGCKDTVMMRLMLEGQQLGKNVLPVLERYEEFDMLHQVGQELEGSASTNGTPTPAEGPPGAGRPFQFGVRVRLSTSGAGLWSESGGENSKFGISLEELLRMAEQLRAGAHPPQLRLLHFHLGSQLAEIDNVRQAVQEAGRIYAHLYRRGLPLAYLDIGGGLGVSYEAGNPEVPGSINYTLDAYTRAVIETLKAVCEEEHVPPPVVVSESGRAVTAYHSVLLVEAVGTRMKGLAPAPLSPAEEHTVLAELRYLLDHLCSEEIPADLEALSAAYRAAEVLRLQAIDHFRQGALSLEQKAEAERRYWSACHAIYDRLRRTDPEAIPEGLAGLTRQLSDQYLCNFSVFRSIVDHWAIGQRFPIMPIHRLEEQPTRRGILVDLTCDSDGKVARFVSPEGDKRHLELHTLEAGAPYYLGIFLMGAYQDIMGDMHNLFGRVTEAHVYADAEEPGNFYIEKILPGATVEEQLALVQYFPNDLERRMNDLILQKVRAGRVRPKEGVRLLEQYKKAFREFTYLNTREAGA